MSGRVKLLEWEEPSSATNGCWVGRGSLHWTRHPCEEGYSISHNMSLYSVFVDDGRPGEQQDLGEFENVAAAKAAAQADYEQRVLAAIEPDATPSPAAEADRHEDDVIASLPRGETCAPWVARRAGELVQEKRELESRTNAAEAEVARLRAELAEWQEAKRKLEHQQYEHPWTVNDAARERIRAEAAEADNTRLRAREAELMEAVCEVVNSEASGAEDATRRFQAQSKHYKAREAAHTARVLRSVAAKIRARALINGGSDG